MSLVSDSVQSFWSVQSEQGWRPALSSALKFLRSVFFEFHKGFLLRLSLEEPISVPAPRVVMDIKQVGLGDLALLETIMPPLRVKRVAKKMQAGEVCFVAVRDERAIAYVFAGFAGTPSTRDAHLQLRPEDAYFWAGYALPQYRRQGVVKAVNLSLCRHLQDKGYESVILLVDDHNVASLGHCYKMGYRVTDRITYLKVVGWRTSRHTPIEETGYTAATLGVG
jgi:ribosomal protein S18 acetylase RimI-like enzyme